MILSKTVFEWTEIMSKIEEDDDPGNYSLLDRVETALDGKPFADLVSIDIPDSEMVDAIRTSPVE